MAGNITPEMLRDSEFFRAEITPYLKPSEVKDLLKSHIEHLKKLGLREIPYSHFLEMAVHVGATNTARLISFRVTVASLEKNLPVQKLRRGQQKNVRRMEVVEGVKLKDARIGAAAISKAATKALMNFGAVVPSTRRKRIL